MILFIVLCRYNILELVKIYIVYVMDFLGFGWFEKVLIEYNVDVWWD